MLHISFISLVIYHLLHYGLKWPVVDYYILSQPKPTTVVVRCWRTRLYVWYMCIYKLLVDAVFMLGWLCTMSHCTVRTRLWLVAWLHGPLIACS